MAGHHPGEPGPGQLGRGNQTKRIQDKAGLSPPFLCCDEVKRRLCAGQAYGRGQRVERLKGRQPLGEEAGKAHQPMAGGSVCSTHTPGAVKRAQAPPVIQSGGWLGTVIGHVAGRSCREIWNLERLSGTKSPAAKNLPHGQLAKEEGAAPVMQRRKSPGAVAVKRFLACGSE